MSLKRQLQESIDPIYKQDLGMILAQIVFYDDTTNRADVKYDDPSAGGVVTLKGVPVEIASLGLASAGPFPGDQVYVSFLNNNPTLPRIIGRADGDYKYYSRKLYEHPRSGAYMPLQYTSSNLTSSNNAPTEGGETNEEKKEPTLPSKSYTSYIAVGTQQTKAKYLVASTFSAASFEDQSSQFANYLLAEVGLTHPGTESSVKLYNNGVIDVFACTDLGMRVDPTSLSLTFNSMYECHQATDCAFNIDNSMSIMAGSTVAINAGGTCDISAGSIYEQSSDHVVTTGVFAVSSTTRTSLNSAGEVLIDGPTVRIQAHSSFKVIGNGADILLNGSRLEGNLDTVSFTGSSFSVTADELSLESNKQKEKFNHYVLDAKTAEFKMGSFKHEVDGEASIQVGGLYSLNAKTLSMSGEGEATFSFERLQFTSVGEGMLFDSSGRIQMQADNGLVVQSENVINLDAAQSVGINSKSKGSFCAKDLEFISTASSKYTAMGALTLDGKDLKLKSSSTIDMNATSAITANAPSMTYKSSSGISLDAPVTRVNGEQLFLTGGQVNLNASNVTVNGEFKANIDKLVKDYLTRKKSEVLSILGLSDIDAKIDSKAGAVFDRKFPSAHEKAHANDPKD